VSTYLDCYIADPKDLKEGHGVEEIYARVPVYDDKDKVLTWLCRVTEDQYRHLSKAGLVTTWATVDKKATKIIKDKANKDKEIPTIVFGGSLVSPGSAIVVPDKSEVDVGAKPVEHPKELPGEVLPAPKIEFVAKEGA
jgi:hypothetical protein